MRPNSTTIQISGDRYIDFANPDLSCIEIGDIVNGLATLQRWRGAGLSCSVLFHSVHVSDCAGQLARNNGMIGGHIACAAYWGLLHDAHEFLTGDLPTPLKRVIGGAWNNIEALLLLRLCERFGLHESIYADSETWAVWQTADRMVTHAEAIHYLGPSASAWATDPWDGWAPPSQSEWYTVDAFLQRYESLRARLGIEQ